MFGYEILISGIFMCKDKITLNDSDFMRLCIAYIVLYKYYGYTVLQP